MQPSWWRTIFPSSAASSGHVSIGWEGRNNKGGWREFFYRWKLLKSLQKKINYKFIKIMGNETIVLFTKHYRAASTQLELSQVRTLPAWVLLRLLRTQFLVRINTNGFTLGRHQEHAGSISGNNSKTFLESLESTLTWVKSRWECGDFSVISTQNYLLEELISLRVTDKTVTLGLGVCGIMFLSTSSGFSLNIIFLKN